MKTRHKITSAGLTLSFAALITLMLILPGCKREQGITLAGSTSVQPFAEILTEHYMVLHPDQVINVQGGGSSAGIKAVLDGATDIGMSSRELTAVEKPQLNETTVALDGLALVVNPQNPVRNLTIEQARGIYTRAIRKWNEVGGPDWDIHVVTREEGSGTRSAFIDLVMGKTQITPRAIVEDSNGAVRVVIAGDKASVGYISLGLVNQDVRAVSIDGVAPTRENIENKTYGLWRRFLMLTKGPGKPEANQFIQFVLSPEGQQILASEGLISVQTAGNAGQ